VREERPEDEPDTGRPRPAAGDDRGNLPDLDDVEWAAYRAQVEGAAVEAARRAGERS